MKITEFGRCCSMVQLQYITVEKILLCRQYRVKLQCQVELNLVLYIGVTAAVLGKTNLAAKNKPGDLVIHISEKINIYIGTAAIYRS